MASLHPDSPLQRAAHRSLWVSVGVNIVLTLHPVIVTTSGGENSVNIVLPSGRTG